MVFRHVPVMRQEVAHYLNCRPGGVYVDGTLGGAGHARDICASIGADGLLIGIDQDPSAIDHARENLLPHAPGALLFHDNFANLPAILAHLKRSNVDGILLDLGLSLHQLEASGRGFTFRGEEPLDMRMNPDEPTPAAKLVNTWDEAALTRLFRTYGEERWSRRIARQIVDQRRGHPIETNAQLVAAIQAAIPRRLQAKSAIHPATRVFMALRIAVNRELERLENFLSNVDVLLSPGGRLCIISFHSLEDRLVKRRMGALTRTCVCPPGVPVCRCSATATMRSLTRKVVRPSARELAGNPMARSARLRAYEKRSIPGPGKLP